MSHQSYTNVNRVDSIHTTSIEHSHHVYRTRHVHRSQVPSTLHHPPAHRIIGGRSRRSLGAVLGRGQQLDRGRAPQRPGRRHAHARRTIGSGRCSVRACLALQSGPSAFPLFWCACVVCRTCVLVICACILSVGRLFGLLSCDINRVGIISIHSPNGAISRVPYAMRMLLCVLLCVCRVSHMYVPACTYVHVCVPCACAPLIRRCRCSRSSLSGKARDRRRPQASTCPPHR